MVLVVVLSVAIITPAVYLSAQSQKKISRQFIDNAAQQALDKGLKMKFTPTDDTAPAEARQT